MPRLTPRQCWPPHVPRLALGLLAPAVFGCSESAAPTAIAPSRSSPPHPVSSEPSTEVSWAPAARDNGPAPSQAAAGRPASGFSLDLSFREPTRRERALEAVAAGRYEDALGPLQSEVLDAPRDLEVLYPLAETLAGLGRRPEAIVLLKEALAVDPQHAPSRLLRGVLRLSIRDYVGAREDLAPLADVDGAAPEVFVNLATAELQLGQFGRALELMDRASAADDQFPVEGHYVRCVALSRLRRIDEAESVLQSADAARLPAELREMAQRELDAARKAPSGPGRP